MFFNYKLYFPEYLGNVHLPGLVPYIALAGIIGFILAIVPGLIYIERVVMAFMQDRSGPNRVGPRGLLQTIADGVKLFFKEDTRPRSVDVRIYFLAPIIALTTALIGGAVLPIQEITFIRGAHSWGAYPQPGLLFSVPLTVGDVNIGLLYILAVSSLQAYGVVLAGWSSNNKYSLLGGLRASAQLISYELSMGLALLCVVLLAGSLKLNRIVDAQNIMPFGYEYIGGTRLPEFLRGSIFSWYWLGSLGIPFIIYTIAMIAETNRAPFDLPEAESELIAGFMTEYSSMKYAIFFMGEYAAMLTVSGLNAAVFWGGPLPPLNIAPLNLIPGFIWFILKIMVGIYFYVWLRSTLPRLRYDALMNLGWKRMLPLGLVWLFLLAGYDLLRAPNTSPPPAIQQPSLPRGAQSVTPPEARVSAVATPNEPRSTRRYVN
jgi:NADH-quinone oxidoreductase subunit H